MQTINTQPALRTQIEQTLVPHLYGLERTLREYNKRFGYHIKARANNRGKSPLDIIGENGDYEVFLGICLKHYPQWVI